MFPLLKHASISIIGDRVQFGVLDIDIILEMSWLHIHRAKIDCKNYKVNLRGGNRPCTCFYRQSTDKHCSLMFNMKVSISCQETIEYWYN